MRFVSKSPAYTICYKRDIIQTYGLGETQVVQPLWNCQFRTGGITSAEIEQARTLGFMNHGTQVEQDGVTLVDPAARYSVFDTVQFQEEHRNDIFERTPNGFDDAERKQLEEFLIAHQDEWYRKLEVVRLPAPWPNYDEFRGDAVRGSTAVRIAERVTEDGYDPATVIAYERENKGRQDVIDALEALTAEPEVEAEDLVAA